MNPSIVILNWALFTLIYINTNTSLKNVSDFLIFWSSFISQSERPNRNGVIICHFEIATWTMQLSQPIFAGFSQSCCTGFLAISKGRIVWPFPISPSLLLKREDKNIKILQTYSFKEIYKCTLCFQKIVWNLM